MLRVRMEINLDLIAGGSDYSDVLFNLITWAESEGRVDELLEQAVAEKPGNPNLKRLVDRSPTQAARTVATGYGPHREAVADALQRAFSRRNDLERLTYFKLNLNIETLPGNTLGELVVSLIRWAETHGRERDLIEGAREANPGNRMLAAVAEVVLKFLDERSEVPPEKPDAG
jgi:effector-associated domain 1 (EAD1)-containing protein